MKKALAVFALWSLLASNIAFGYTIGSSMYPNIYNAVCMIEKVKPETLKRGDIVSFKTPDNDTDVAIKRIIGLPGETIEIKNGKVYINGKVLNEPYLKNQKTEWFYKGEMYIPKGTYFVMGDNRSNSYDSRNYGPVRLDKYLEGKVVYWVNGVGKIPQVILQTAQKLTQKLTKLTRKRGEKLPMLFSSFFRMPNHSPSLLTRHLAGFYFFADRHLTTAFAILYPKNKKGRA